MTEQQLDITQLMNDKKALTEERDKLLQIVRDYKDEKIVVELYWYVDDDGRRVYDTDEMTNEFNVQLQSFVDKVENESATTNKCVEGCIEDQECDGAPSSDADDESSTTPSAADRWDEMVTASIREHIRNKSTNFVEDVVNATKTSCINMIEECIQQVRAEKAADGDADDDKVVDDGDGEFPSSRHPEDGTRHAYCETCDCCILCECCECDTHSTDDDIE